MPNSSNQKQKNYPQLSRKFVARRISEGETGRLKEELKCQACGKGYKHVSSLAKHLWEHTPEWNVTSKLLISKHQQVQLLEAASILVSMNDEDSEDTENVDGSASNLSRESSKEPKSEDEKIDSKFDRALEKTLGRAIDKELESRLRSKYRNLRPEAIPKAALEPTAEYPEKSSESSSKQSSVSMERDSDSAIDVEELTPAKDIPILSARPIAKTPAKHSHRRLSTNAGSLGSSLSSLGLGRQDHMVLLQASPLPESVLVKDHAHHPPQRRRRQSTLHASSIPHDSGLSLDDDSLQDPQDSIDVDALQTPKHTPKKSPERSATHDDVFGLEV